MLAKICFELLNEWLNCINQPTVAQTFISIDIYLQKINENGTSYTQDSAHEQTEGQPTTWHLYIYI